jgi:hypothetical protein
LCREITPREERRQEFRIGLQVSSYGKKRDSCSVPWFEEVVMEGTAQGKTGGEVTFEIEGQLAGKITNVGGDQNTFLGEAHSRGAVFGRVVALFGLTLSLVGLGSLVLAGVKTADAVMPAPPDWSDYQDYVATRWLSVALILIVVGVVVGKIGRLLTRR